MLVFGIVVFVSLIVGFIFRDKLKKVLATAKKNIQSEGSAFAKVAAHEALALETKGKIIALKAANKATHALADELEAAASAVHADADFLSGRLAAVSSRL